MSPLAAVSRLAALALLVPATAFAADLTVARDPEPSVVVAAPSPRRDDREREKPREVVREGYGVGLDLYAFTGPTVDDFAEGGFLARIALEAYGTFGLGDVSLMLGGTVLAIDTTYFRDRTSHEVPALTVLGVRDDSWQVAIAGGASVYVDDEYDDRDDAERSLPSPRGELRAGYRWGKMVELNGVVGAERRLFENRDDVTRLFFGATLGIAGDTLENKK
jgi:hypothetical protein